MPEMFIGIDPGKSGGIAFAFDGNYDAIKMPATLADVFSELVNATCDATALIEKVGPMPKQGVKSMFSFGENYGALQMVLTALGCPWDLVTPAKWQKEFGLYGKKLEGTAKKNAHKAVAQRLFPTVKVTHATADALLIAEYCRRKHGTKP